MRGIVYILKAEEMERFKIGYTTKPLEERVSQLQSGSPVKLSVYRTFKSFQVEKLEKILHSLLDRYRVSKRSEWFEISSDYIDITLNHLFTMRENGHFSLAPHGTSGMRLRLTGFSIDNEGAVFLDGLYSPDCNSVSDLENVIYPLIHSLLDTLNIAQELANVLIEDGDKDGNIFPANPDVFDFHEDKIKSANLDKVYDTDKVLLHKLLKNFSPCWHHQLTGYECNWCQVYIDEHNNFNDANNHEPDCIWIKVISKFSKELENA